MTVWCIPAEGTHILSQIHRRRNQISGVSFLFIFCIFLHHSVVLGELGARELNWVKFILSLSPLTVVYRVLYGLDMKSFLHNGYWRSVCWLYEWSFFLQTALWKGGKCWPCAFSSVHMKRCWVVLVLLLWNVFNWLRYNNAPLNN